VGQVVPGRRGYHINNAYGHDGLKLSDIQGSYNVVRGSVRVPLDYFPVRISIGLPTLSPYSRHPYLYCSTYLIDLTAQLEATCKIRSTQSENESFAPLLSPLSQN